MKMADRTSKPRRKIRAGRGALWLLAGFMLLSAVLRFAGETGAAIAREIAALGESSGEMVDQDGADRAEVEAVLKILADRMSDLDIREEAVSGQEAALAAAKAEIAEQLAVLVEAEARLRETISMAKGVSEGDLARLTTMYDTMKPKEAAPLFEQMAPEFAAGFIARMQPQSAADLMAALQPDIAYSISVVLASRNAGVPTK